MTALRIPRRIALPAAALAALAVVGISVQVNLARLCSPAGPAEGCRVSQANRVETAEALRRHIGANPAASDAYVRLVTVLEPEVRADAIHAANRLAPQDPNLILARAQLALAQNRVPDAVRDLVQLVEQYHPQVPQAALALGRLVESGHADALRVHLRPGTQWLSLVLGKMSEARIPLASAGPLIAQATQTGALPPERLRELTRSLKEAGNWVDAYGVWAAQHGNRVPVLYNAGFEQAFVADGFDWEIEEGPPGRGGVQVSRRRFPARGPVLELQFTGRGLPQPPVRQLLFLGAGRYRLIGQYRTENLRTEQGLVWAVRCVARPADPPVGRSEALIDSQGTWGTFAFEVEIPPSCGPVASLQLETAAAFEAAAGLRGRALFDTFTLTPLAGS